MTTANTAEWITRNVMPDPYKSQTGFVIERQAERLLNAGMSPGEVHDVIDSIVGAMRSEYGE